MLLGWVVYSPRFKEYLGFSDARYECPFWTKNIAKANKFMVKEAAELRRDKMRKKCGYLCIREAHMITRAAK